MRAAYWNHVIREVVEYGGYGNVVCISDYREIRVRCKHVRLGILLIMKTNKRTVYSGTSRQQNRVHSLHVNDRRGKDRVAKRPISVR